LANEGDPSMIEPPFNPDGNQRTLDETPAAALLGKGSEVVSEVQTLGFGAGIGIAFPFEFRGRKLWVKPSAGWTRWTVDVDGVVLQGLKPDPDPRLQLRFFSPLLRVVDLQKSVSQSYNAIGPGLDLELEAFRAGPLGVNVFAGGAAYRVIGDRKIAWSVVETIEQQSAEDFPDDTYTARFSYKVSPWMYRIGLGIRFQWLGRR
jgi:hypothetical protein